MKNSKINRTKKRIIEALEDNSKRVLHIEIMRSEYMANRWDIRIGDIIGSTELSNVDIKEVLREVEDEMLSLHK